MTQVTNQSETSNTIVLPFMEAINAQREAENLVNDAKLIELKAAKKAALIEHSNANIAADFDWANEAVIKAAEAVKAADNELSEFTKKLTALTAEREAADMTNVAKYDLADKFGIELSKLEALLEASKAANDTLKTSFTAYFGKPVLYAKAGATGKSLVNAASASSNGEAKQNKSDLAEADLLAGLTHDELLLKYPTVVNGEADYSKLNGTVRLAINRLKLSKNEAGVYVARAAK